ncbi:MAG: hypothetical protein HY508_05245 [Acidobacteria bacterium]|nr:hypothetical protein [Acidobacteriota bacterium]
MMSATHTLQLGMAVFMLASAPAGRAQNRTVIPLVATSDWRLVKTEHLDFTAVAAFGVEPAIEREYGVRQGELRHYQLGAQ